jgi:hypothetical protein
MTAEVKKFKTFRDLSGVTSSSSISSTSSTSITTSSSSTPKEISPVKDYQKIPNSITRDALPTGIFKGKSKLVYDYLWSRSRGAIKPSRVVKVSRRQIKEKTAIGSMVTVDAALAQLQAVGLIGKVSAVGSASGNNYEIFAPDELPSSPSITSTSKIYQNLDVLDELKNSSSSTTQIVENTELYKRTKTLFKDFEPFDDDSPVYEAFKLLESRAKRHTGRALTRNDWKSFLDLIRMFVDETDLAVSRTTQVSSYLALGTENLQRRLYPKKQPKQKVKDWQSVGNTAPTTPTSELIEPLNEELRQTVLKSLQHIIKKNGREAIDVYKGNYTSEDWDWFIIELQR